MANASEVLDTEEVKRFVISAHSDLASVRDTLGRTPAFLNAAYFWSAEDGETAIQAAAHMARRDIAEYLLDRGAAMTLGAAAMLGQRETVETMLKAEPSSANKICVHNMRVLYHAALSGDVDLAQLLVSFGCTQDFNHALHAAVVRNHPLMAEWLLENGVTNANTLNFQKKTPLAVAVEQGFEPVARILQAYGAVEQSESTPE